MVVIRQSLGFILTIRSDFTDYDAESPSYSPTICLAPFKEIHPPFLVANGV